MISPVGTGSRQADNTQWFASSQLSVIALAVVLVLIDQASKMLVQAFLTPHQSVQLIPGLLRLTHYANYGGIGGIGQGSPSTIPLLVSASVALGALILLVYRCYVGLVVPSRRMQLFVALTIAPLFSHSFERLRQGFVVDFLQIGGTPVFNFADLLPHLAIVLLCIELVIHLRKRRETVANLPSQGAEAA